MPSLRSINLEAGTNFRRWKEVPQALRDLKVAQPVPEPKPEPVPAVPEPDDVPARAYVPETLANHPDIAKALAEGYSIGDVKNGRNAARRQHTKIRAAARHYGSRSDEVQDAIGEANRVSVMLTTARAAYNRITYPERYR